MRTPFRAAGVLASETINGSGDPPAFLAVRPTASGRRRRRRSDASAVAQVFETLLARALPEDLGALSVKALKRALAERRVSAAGCAEKGDLVALLADADARLLAASP